MCSLPLFSATVSPSFRSPVLSYPRPLLPQTLQSRASAPRMFQSGCFASPDVPVRVPRVCFSFSSLFPSLALLVLSLHRPWLSCTHPLPLVNSCRRRLFFLTELRTLLSMAASPPDVPALVRCSPDCPRPGSTWLAAFPFAPSPPTSLLSSVLSFPIWSMLVHAVHVLLVASLRRHFLLLLRSRTFHSRAVASPDVQVQGFRPPDLPVRGHCLPGCSNPGSVRLPPLLLPLPVSCFSRPVSPPLLTPVQALLFGSCRRRCSFLTEPWPLSLDDVLYRSLPVDPDWLRCFPGCFHPGSMCLAASPSSLSPPASRLCSFLSSPIRSLLLFLFPSPCLSAAVSFSLFVAPDIPFPGRFVPGRSSPGALRRQMFQSAAPGAPPDDPVWGFGPCSCPPRMLQSGASFCRILSVALDDPVRGPGFPPGRSSPRACAVLHSALDASIRGVFLSYSLCCLGRSSSWHRVLPRTIQSGGLGCAPLRPWMLQSGASFSRILSVASDAPVRGTGFTPRRSSPGASAVLHSAPDAPIQGVIFSYPLRCLGCSSPRHRFLPRTFQSGGLGRAPLRPGCSNPGRLYVAFSLLPRTLQSVAPGSPPDDPVRGLGPSSTPPRMLQSGASCIFLSLLSSAHQPHSARSCELALRAVGAARGRPGGRLLPGCRASGVGRSPTPDQSSFRACGRGPLPAGRGCGVRAWGPFCPWHLVPCRGPSCVVRASWVRGTRWPFSLGTCPCAVVVPGSVPLWRASWPRVGAPLLVRSGRSRCSGRLSCCRGVFSHPGGCPPGFTGWLRGARGGRLRTGLIVPAAGACRGKGAGRAPRRTRSGPRDGVVPGGSLRLRSWAACAAVVRRVWTRSLTHPVTRTVCLSTGNSADAPGLFRVDADTTLAGRRTPRPGPACVCVRALLGWVGRAGLPGAFWCASPFPWPFLVRSLLVRPPPGRGCPVCGCCWVFSFFLFSSPPLLRPRCVLLCVFSGPGCLGPWRLVAPRPPPFFLPPPPPSVRPVVSCFSCFPASGALGLGLLLPPPFSSFVFCPPPPPPVVPGVSCFPAALGLYAPPTPFLCFLFFVSPFFFFLLVVRCGPGLCVLGRRVCPCVPWWCCPCRCSVCAGWCSVVLAFGPGCPVLSPAGSWCRASVVLSLSGSVARRPVVRRGVSWCSAALCCVVLRCAVVWWCAVVLCRLFASSPVPVVCFLPLRVCCVCSGVACCVFPVLSALCGAVLRCAGALLLCCAVSGSWCCWFQVSLHFVGGLLVALVAWRCRLVVCVGFGARVWFGRRLASSLWCPGRLCCVLWCCAALWFCAVVPCLFFVFLLAGGAGFLLFPAGSGLRAGSGSFLLLCSACAVPCWCACVVALCSETAGARATGGQEKKNKRKKANKRTRKGRLKPGGGGAK